MEYEEEYWTKRYTFHDWNEDWPTESTKITASENADREEILDAVSDADDAFAKPEIKISEWKRLV